MRAQILLQGGPLHDEFVGVSTIRGEWPDDIRCADDGGKKSEDKIEAAFYNKGEIEHVDAIYFGTYTFVGIKPSAPSLITVWTKE